MRLSRVIIVAYSLSVCTWLHAQDDRTKDSLWLNSKAVELFSNFCYKDFNEFNRQLDLVFKLADKHKFYEDKYTATLWSIYCAKFWSDYESMNGSLIAAEKLLDIMNSSFLPETSLLKKADLWNRRGEYNLLLGNYKEAYAMFRKALDSISVFPCETEWLLSYQAKALLNLATMNYALKNPEDAIQYLKQSINVQKKNQACFEFDMDVYTSYLKLSDIMIHNHDLAGATHQLCLAEEDLNAKKKNFPERIKLLKLAYFELHLKRANVAYLSGDYKQAHDEVECAKKFSSNTQVELYDYTEIKSLIYQKVGDNVKAIQLWDNLRASLNVQKNLDLEIKLNTKLGELYLEMNRLSQAAKHFDLVQNLLIYPFDDLAQFINEVNMLNPKIQSLMQNFIQLSKCSFEQKNWIEAQRNLANAFQLAKKVFLNKYSEKDKEYLLEALLPLKDWLVTLNKSTALYTDKQIFDFVNLETVKMQSILEPKINSMDSISLSFQRLKNLEFFISELEKQLYFNKNKKEIDFFTDKLLQLRQQKKELLLKYRLDMEFHREPDVLLSDLIQQKLAIDEQFIQIIICQERISLLCLGKVNIKIYQVDKIRGFEDSIQSFLKSVHIPSDQHWRELGHFLYYQLSMDKIIQPGVKKLVFSTHGNMSLVPFEVMNKSNNKQEFLINDYDISYFNPEALTHFGRSAVPVSIRQAYFFAPIFEGNSSVSSTLLHNIAEVNLVSEHFLYKKKYVYNLPCLDQMKNQNFSGSILHFSTHASVDHANNKFSFISFGDISNHKMSEPLFYNDLSYLNIPAELVVLNGCETGLGNVDLQGGVHSMATSFFQSGAKSVMSSLWKVNDAISSHITDMFYIKLSEGKFKDEALRDAKLYYLKNADPLYMHPYYWAAYILTGDNSKLTWSKPWSFTF